MISRRQLLKRGAVGGAVLAFPGQFYNAASAAAPPKAFQTDLQAFIPPVVTGNAHAFDIAHAQVPVHPALPAVDVWTYRVPGGPSKMTWLGPTIVAGTGPSAAPVSVDYTVRPAGMPKHLFEASIDPDFLEPYARDGAVVGRHDLRFLTHLHGALVSGASDGNPHDRHWHDEFGPGAPNNATVGNTQSAIYPVQDRAGMLWYHQHAHGLTHLNVMAGLAGAYLLRDGKDTGAAEGSWPAGALRLPSGPFEVPLVLQDRVFAGGQNAYPASPWVPEFFGDVMTVNGALEPFLSVQPRRYRLRVLNGSNARFYNLAFTAGDRSPPPVMWVIGTEGGLLANAVGPVPSVVLAPGERLDLIVDFAGCAGDKLQLRNRPLPKGIVSPAPPLGRVMQFRVGAGPVADPTDLPGVLDPGRQPVDGLSPVGGGPLDPLRRNITLEEVMGPAGPVMSILNGKTFDGRRPHYGPGMAVQGPPYTEPGAPPYAAAQEVINDGDTEEWRFINTTADTHPMHVHLVQFGLVSRQRFDAVGYQADLDFLRANDGSSPNPTLPSGRAAGLVQWDDRNQTIAPEPYVLGPATGAPPDEAGWKDTVRANPGQITTIRARFKKPEGSTRTERYVYHCHILEHETNSMMRPFDVV